ncbi:hypothetical protein OSB04_012115 [Centaurea solstitialis]|uniref:PGG domain-containing protein n=1 Tax=Centaurea solstitialis TaxID=347529 RepID=A0AA38TLH6_9ASTR|nr:hypothetical protein OSB04_012115 [Centaurea solstitialis]
MVGGGSGCRWRWWPEAVVADGNRSDYIKFAIPLYNASIKGDWKAAEAILGERPELVRWAITENHETALHVASSTKSNSSVNKFVENLVRRMTKEQLELRNTSSNTALCLTAVAGNVEIARILVNENRNLLNIPGYQNMMPLYMACLSGQREMVKYLYDNSDRMSGDFWTHQNRGWVLLKCVESDIFVCIKLSRTLTHSDAGVLTAEPLPKYKKGPIPSSQLASNCYKSIHNGGKNMVSEILGGSTTVDAQNVALQIVTDREELRKNEDVLRLLAQKPNAFRETKLNYFRKVINQILHVNIRHAEDPSCDALKLLRVIWTTIARLPKNEIDNIVRGPPDKITTGKEEKPDMLQLVRTISEVIQYIPVTVCGLLNLDNVPTKREYETRYAERDENTRHGIKKYSSRVLFVAAENGNTEFVVELIRQYTDLIWKVNDDNQSIFHVAVSHRHEGIYNLLYEIGSMKDMITPLRDHNDNTLLHLVGMSARKKRLGDVSGYALQMQRELLWFKEVESLMPPSYRKRKNKDGLTPHELFTNEHKELLFAAEKWMKDTASQCMVVAALIATIVFAAAFTVPGGYC